MYRLMVIFSLRCPLLLQSLPSRTCKGACSVHDTASRSSRSGSSAAAPADAPLPPHTLTHHHHHLGTTTRCHQRDQHDTCRRHRPSLHTETHHSTEIPPSHLTILRALAPQTRLFSYHAAHNHIPPVGTISWLPNNLGSICSACESKSGNGNGNGRKKRRGKLRQP